MNKLNKDQTTSRILEAVKNDIKPCTKNQVDNIVFPKWSDLGLLGMIFSQKIKTKEQPNGCDYDEVIYRVVLRVLGGKVLGTGGLPDSYTWKQSKLEDIDPANIRLIGCNSAQGILNLSSVLGTIKDEKEKTMVADMFCSLNKDLLLVTTASESRRCVEITQELFDAGVTACVDSWMETDQDGNAKATMLNVGDFLIVDGESVYCIRRDEFMLTHSLA